MLIVLPHDGFWAPDYEPVRDELEKAGARVVVASTAAGPAKPLGRGQPVVPDVLLQDARAADYDAVVCVGWEVGDLMADTPGGRQAARLLGEMLRADKYVAGLCGGRRVLGEAGVLDGREAAGGGWLPPARRAVLGLREVSRPVVVSGHVITGRSPEDAVAFTRTLLECLKRKG